MKDDDGREEEGTSARVFRPGTTTAAGASLSLARAMAALLLWQGAIHFNVALAAACAFVFPARVAMLVLCTQLFSVLVPADGTSRFGSSIARFICKHGLGYFPVTLQVEHYEAFDPQGAYVFGYEPHSIMPFGAWALTEPASCMPLPKMKILTSSAVAFIKSRKGFVKIAMQNGCPLVPIFCFGQNDAYKWWNPDIKLLTRIATALKSIPVIYWGKFGTPIPYRTPMHVFVGKPIPVEKRGQPTKNEVNEVHGQFVTALQELFEKNKAKAGYPDLHLEIV
ncbi:hypothetical protein PAHAL_6G163000 [Panicum hallii]|uniref:Acyltransferase n=1 Tax=Panicum hallii TaxID=206008 RepID=A0A2S3I1U7_9POAL|nr:hypothetical protein PAHAL_6G163000 [Panicum hallii]